MDHFTYINSTLCAEEIPVSKIASEIGTPFYCYSEATLTRHFQVFSEAFSDIPTTICFAVKANSNLAVLKTLADLGGGADTVSEGEIRRARSVGIPAEKIVFSGVGKTRDEMRYALGVDIAQFNVESLEELEMLNEVAGDLGIKARIAVRVNPDVDANTHDKISTGRKTDKFGVAWEQIHDVYEKASKMKWVEITGVTTHIGSQLTALEPFKKAFDRITELVISLREAGHNIKNLDLGGGLGIPYGEGENPPSPKDYADMIIDTVKNLGCNLILEPGRLIVGNAGILVAKVARVKKTPEREFVIVDAAMNDLARPSMYDSFHEIVTVREHSLEEVLDIVDIVGPICESSDVFARQRPLAKVATDDLVAFRSCGAYGAVQAGTYNSRPLIAEVMVKGDEYAVIRKRQTYDELLGQDNIPEWKE